MSKTSSKNKKGSLTKDQQLNHHQTYQQSGHKEAVGGAFEVLVGGCVLMNFCPQPEG